MPRSPIWPITGWRFNGDDPAMSLRMIGDVLRLRDIATHCPLCGRSTQRYVHTEEHIVPLWLQQKHDLLNQRLTIPNFIDKRYRSVKIGICARCNNQRFGAIESRLAPAFTHPDPYAALARVDDAVLAFWLGKIHWLLARKSHSAHDHRQRDDPSPGRILPTEVLEGQRLCGMTLRCFATGKGMVACHRDDPPVPQFFYEAPYTLYRFRIDERDQRIGAFDLIDNAMLAGIALRSGSVGLICLFDGGIHGRFLTQRYAYLDGNALHPRQFSELVGQIFYDQTVCDPSAAWVDYFWNTPLRAVVARLGSPRHWDPYLAKHDDPQRRAHMLGFYTQQDPASVMTDDGRFFTSLRRLDGSFLPFAVTEAELEAARLDPTMELRPPINPTIRRRLFES
ncbi:hypothetical protein [Bosea rubneri]|uniref:HNH endonuclease n=1 Tax=Bosea rubneri TaxID=3075434 RepID=A0ABU3SAM9_9HYPH|nr:hypothetical protein [Bosea sp. ZW T0_25]MDU0341845.1 hypothetical protein [Bosea sp. ZW T0_25]